MEGRKEREVRNYIWVFYWFCFPIFCFIIFCGFIFCVACAFLFALEFSLELCNITTSFSLVIQLPEQVDQCELEKNGKKRHQRVFNLPTQTCHKLSRDLLSCVKKFLHKELSYL